MQEVISQVSERAGISDAQAKVAVQTVLDYLKDRLPSPLDGQVEKALQGADVTESVESVTKGLGGGLFGDK